MALMKFRLIKIFMKFRQSIKKPFLLESPPQKIIIDMDGGLQDILAVYCAHRLIIKQKLPTQIIGITCVAGRKSLQVSTKSALSANYLMGECLPIYMGQKQSLVLQKKYPDTYIKNDFLKLEEQMYQLSENLHHCIKKDKKAVDFIIQSAREYKDKLGIIAFGPLTNIGLAQSLQHCLNDIKLISINGGQYTGIGTTIDGNVQPNFAYDPLAVHILIQSPKLRNKIYINPVEKTLKYDWKSTFTKCYHQCSLKEDRRKLLQLLVQEENNKFMMWGPFLTILPVIMPKFVKYCHHVYAQIVRDSQKVDGLLAINWFKSNADEDYPDKIFIYEGFDKEAIDQKLLSVLNI